MESTKSSEFSMRHDSDALSSRQPSSDTTAARPFASFHQRKTLIGCRFSLLSRKDIRKDTTRDKIIFWVSFIEVQNIQI
jgi:hypothetical protein